MSKFTIEKGIPIPKISKTGRSPGELRRAMESMEVGDSILLGDKRKNSLYSSAKALKSKTFSTRKTAEGVRLWRVK